MSVRDFAPGKEVVEPRGMWSAFAQKRKGSPQRASMMLNARIAPGVVGSRPGTSAVAAATGQVTGLFNWIAPSGSSYVLYRDGTAIKSLLLPSTITTLLSSIGTTFRPSFADLDVWTYLTGYDTSSHGTLQCRIYDGTNIDKAFRGPVTLTAAAAVDGGAGQCTAGTHLFGFVYQNRTGFAGVPTTAVASVPISVTLNAGLRQINISVTLPAQTDGGGTASLFLIGTRGDNPNNWYFLPTDPRTGAIGELPVPLNTIATLNFVMNLSDEDIASQLAGDSANEQFLLLTQDGSGNGPFTPSFVVAYGERMCYGDGTSLRVSNINNPQYLTGDQHVVTMPNKRSIAYAFPLNGSTDLYLIGDRWTSRVTDNSDVPATWAQPIKISDAIGAPFPACVCYRTGGNYAWVVSEGGAYLFNGTYPERPITYLCSDQWARVNWTAAYAIETADDVAGLRFYIAVPLDGATTPTHLFVIDYTNGIEYDQVDISLDVFSQPGGIGGVS